MALPLVPWLKLIALAYAPVLLVLVATTILAESWPKTVFLEDF